MINNILHLFLRTKLVKRQEEMSAILVLTDKTRQETRGNVRTTSTYGQNSLIDKEKCPQYYLATIRINVF